MIINREVTSIHDVETWSGASTTVATVCEAGKEEELMFLLEDMFPNGASDVEINDFLWFDSDFIYRSLGMVEEIEE